MQETPSADQSIKSLWGKAALSLCAIMWAATGWWIVITGGFTKSFRHSPHTIYVDGPPALAMAYLFFLLATTAVWSAVQSWKPKRFIYGAISVAIMGAPTVYLIFQ